jgi:trans-aconitate methyltransferase
MTAAVFDRPYQANPNPWATDTRWYEERKRALLLASLGRRQCRRGYEPGCGNGNLTVSLAARCTSFVASDVSGEGLTLAKARYPADSDVTFVQLALPSRIIWLPAAR